MRRARPIVLGIAIAVTAVVLGGATALADADDSSDTGASPASAQGPGERDRDRALAAFDELRRRQYQAWDDEDGAAFAATFTEDADLVTFNGEYLRTRDGIAEGLQYYFDNYIEDNTIHLLDEHVRFVDARTAIIVRTTCLINDGETACRDGSLSVNTNVMTRRHGHWLQESFQNTRVEPIP